MRCMSVCVCVCVCARVCVCVVCALYMCVCVCVCVCVVCGTKVCIIVGKVASDLTVGLESHTYLKYLPYLNKYIEIGPFY